MLQIAISAFLIAQESYSEPSHAGMGSLASAIPAIGFYLMVILVVAIPVITSHRYKTRLAELNASVKQQMIEKGYSPDEILAVIQEDARLLSKPNGSLAKMTPSRVPLEVERS